MNSLSSKDSLAWTKADHERQARSLVRQLQIAEAERDRYREALAPFRVLADALDAFDGMTDAEWCRIKERVRGNAVAAREALDG